jgi:multidrug efflux pump subunit AcrA (membrane-fusion protein)
MKQLLRNRWFLAVAIILVLGIPSTWLLARGPDPLESSIVAEVKRGEFRVIVSTSGELRALNDIKITGPPNMQQAQVYQVKISMLVPEGTIVKEGDIVAQLDRAPAAQKHTDVSLALQKAQAQHEQAMLDSTLNLSKAREDMKTMELALEEKRIAKDQAKYESPSVRRKAEIDLEKAERALEQAKVDYKTKTEQAQAKMREVGADYQRQQNLLAQVTELMQNFSIKAPASGMVIYVKEWNGKKRTVGSQIGYYDPVVATLPDLSKMESITYVNEIDVRKVAVGQPVVITLDADPSKRMTGKVTQVANVGEQRPNADAKVFEVRVTVEKPDTTLRPGMTTGNAIETLALKDVLYIPLEALIVENGIPVVFKQTGGGVVKQEVETGAMNDDEVVVLRGVDASERVMLSPPANASELEPVRLHGSANTPKPDAAGDTAAKQAVPSRPDSLKRPDSLSGSVPKGATPPAGGSAVPVRRG